MRRQNGWSSENIFLYTREVAIGDMELNPRGSSCTFRLASAYQFVHSIFTPLRTCLIVTFRKLQNPEDLRIADRVDSY
jgi:hypothetical protein